VFPDIVDVKVADTAPPMHSQATSVWKDATLENGLKLQVPPFIAPGEMIRVQVERGEYQERAKKR
jgi:elongation factor P